jgi:DNA invertase Pin-like site-specific DNA recombinase/DNA-directed RNA polymerase subunit M/transcription elongation factor TFIIS
VNNIAIYLRISVLEKGNLGHTEDTINSQRNFIKSFIFNDQELKKANIEEFIDEGYSGSTTSRPGLDKLLLKIKQGKVNCIIVKDMSRFMRNYIEMGDYLENIFPFMGIRFIAINDGYDSSNEIKNGTELDIQFKNLLNDYYSRDISEKMTTALLVAKKQGKYTSGTPPYGYLKDTEDNYKLVIDERVADNVRYIFQLLLEGHTLNETAKILNSEGVITARARRKEIKGYDAYANRWESNVEDTIWSHSMVRRIANNEVYTGTFVFNKSTKSKLDGGKVTYHPKEEWIRVYDNHEALISKETFDEVEGLLKSRHRKSFGVKKKKYQNSPLATFVRCNKCGYKIRFGTSSNGKELISINLHCYHCRMLEQEENLPHYKELEKEVFEILKDKFHTDKAEKKKLLDEQKELYDKNDQLLKKKRIEFEKYKFGKISREDFLEIKNQIQELEEENKERIQAIDEELKQAGSIDSLTKETVEKYINRIYISGKGIERIEYQ